MSETFSGEIAKIDQPELQRLFGDRIPVEAVNLVFDAPPQMLVSEARARLQEMARQWRERGSAATHVTVPVQPTEAMLIAARDWSYQKYGKPIGNEAATGCWDAMVKAAKAERGAEQT